MGFQYKKFNKLSSEFDKSIDAFLDKSGVKSVQKLSNKERVSQVEFLQAFKETLTNKNMGEGKKAMSFTGAMLVVRAMIEDTYNFRSNVSHSKLFSQLANVIGIAANNELNVEDKEECSRQAFNFVRNDIFVGGDFKKGLKEEHSFLNVSHSSSFLKSFLHKSKDMECKYSKECVTEAVKKEQMELQQGQSEKSTSFISKFFSSTKTPAENKEEHLQEKAAPSAK